MVTNAYIIHHNALQEQAGLVLLATQTVNVEMDIIWVIMDNVQVSLNNVLLPPLLMEKDVLDLTMLVLMEHMLMEIDVFLMSLVRMDSSGIQTI